MAEHSPTLATRAPESDTTDQMNSLSGAPTQAGSGAGAHCTTDRPSPTGAPPSGVGPKSDLYCYVSRPSDYPHASAKLLLLLSTGTGFQSKNNQLQADMFASEGFLVVMPDMFGNDPCPKPPGLDIEEPTSPTTVEKLKLTFVHAIHSTSKSFQIDMWLARQTPEKVLPILRKVIHGINQEYADAVSQGGGIYAVGYCFGGKYVLILGSDDASNRARQDGETDDAQRGPLIKVGALAHGTQVTKEDLQNVDSPTCLVCVENDPLFPDEVREEGKKQLEARGITHELKIYPGVPHGFAVVGEYDDEKIKDAQKEAYAQILSWLQTH